MTFFLAEQGRIYYFFLHFFNSYINSYIRKTTFMWAMFYKGVLPHTDGSSSEVSKSG